MHRKEEDGPDLSILTSSSSLEDSVRPLDRFQAIQEKLERYSQTRTIHRERQSQEKISARVAEMEARLAEEDRLMEERADTWREMLAEMRVQAQLQERQMNLLGKERAESIKQLKGAIEMATRQQQQQQAKSERQIADKFSACLENLGRSLEREYNEQAAQVTAMQSRFQVELPSLHERITTAGDYLQSVCSSRGRQVMEQTKSFEEALQSHSASRERSDRRMMQLISCTIEQIQQDLQTARLQRKAAREKLEFLICKASTRIQRLPA